MPVGRRRVGIPADHRAEQGLTQVLLATVDVAADVVRVVRLHRRGIACRSGEDQVAEARREPLDLVLDDTGQVHGRTVRHVAIRPADVLAGGGAARVGDGGLDEQDERSTWDPAAGHRVLGCHDVPHRPRQMDGARATGRRVPPRHRPIERPVDLEDAGTVPEPLELAAIAVGQPVAGDRDDLARRHVEHERSRGWQVVERANRMRADDVHAE